MLRNKKTLLGILVICISVVMVLTVGSKTPPIIVNDFDEIIKGFHYIEGVDFYGNSPSLFIDFDIKEGTTDLELKNAFLKTREVLSNNDVFQRILNFYHDRYGGTLCSLHVTFLFEDGTYYNFYSDKETNGVPHVNAFKYWTLDINGEEMDFDE